MRYSFITAAWALIAAAAHAAPLNIVEVNAPAINCVFNTNCAHIADESASPIVLPGGIGNGSLQTRVIPGEAGSAAEGLYAYLYRVDLTGIVAAPTNPPCFTNIVRCSTNRVLLLTTNVVCKTNVVGARHEVKCETRRVPGTNIVFCFTNTVPATDVIRCATNEAGALWCVTNYFPATNVVFCHTYRLPSSNVITCRTNTIPGSNVVTCASHRTAYFTNVVTCVTNRVPCSEPAPCIDTLHIRFNRVISTLDFDGNGTDDQGFVVTSGGLDTVRPASVEWNDGVVTLRFSPPLCAGDSSVFVGLVSSNAPGHSKTLLGLTSGSTLDVAARAPTVRPPPIQCDFRPLFDVLGSLTSRDLSAPNDSAASGRRNALLNNLTAASAAAQQGNLQGVLESIEAMSKKMSGARLDWLTPDAASRLKRALLDLLNCLEQFNGEHPDREHRQR
ncbi:MAG TPA: hypothetical protein VNT99_04235 [Methylomirabilota bacterium]|nr:hypothetical protein [Methylomirabilota bacterium]